MNKYYDDYRLLTFETEVITCEEEADKYWVVTKESCFFVEGGGMAKDEGTLNALAVHDVKFQDGCYYHLVDEKLAGRVKGEVNFDHRLKKVQIHTAQHLISATLFNKYQLETLSHHVNEDGAEIVFSGINNNVDLSWLEKQVNAYILENLKVSIEYPDFAEASQHASLDKLQHEQLRVVRIGALDYNLCACLHVKALGEIGLIFIMNCETTKNGLIVSYLAGNQINDYFRPRYTQLKQAGKLLALDQLSIAEGIARLQSENKQLNYRYQGLKLEKLEALANSYLQKEGALVIELDNLEVKEGQFFVSYLNEKGFVNEVGLVLKLEGDRCHVLVSGYRAKALFAELATTFNLKGGGNEKTAQGGGDYDKALLTWLKERMGE